MHSLVLILVSAETSIHGVSTQTSVLIKIDLLNKYLGASGAEHEVRGRTGPYIILQPVKKNGAADRIE